ncbi:zinc-dependent alcohol dehydrogenase family protein [Bradyrhizobium sp. PRIMUS42]|uniref:zinc-dependent alcohol dehydrogenase family protein n=1 Tax=Bradyrhizobium sp. PRIMUS42 TaxID=2908926 RepID=UPI001FF69D16|nr:zinc-dependent alcohol dehydrogenase family protein [Bradyrhizobium sp. PRIMUS42]MCJ9728662.1 zinc-dependent alcohol dehydrogenase family protein [Bradyrhizobium sp. PRIMUS42]
MRVRAAVLQTAPHRAPFAVSKPLKIGVIDLDPPGPDEVLVKITAAGLCHSDLSLINGDRPRPTPMLIGHEASAVIEEIGANVHDLRPGDKVVMSFLPTCGHCEPCAEGRAQLCEPGHSANSNGTLLSGARRIHCEGVTVNHHSGVSAFAEYAVVSRRSIVKIDGEIAPVEAALFGCAVMTGVGTVMNTCRVRPGDRVAVIGLGGVGLAAVLGAVASGASRVIAVDISDEKLRIARELGATDLFSAASDNVVGDIRESTKGGVDHAIEMAGSVKAFDLAYRITRRGGKTATAGLANPNSQIQLPPVNLVAEERTIHGSYMGSCVPSRDIPRFIELYKRGALPVNKLLSGTGSLDGINEAFDLLNEGKVVRHVIDFA